MGFLGANAIQSGRSLIELAAWYLVDKEVCGIWRDAFYRVFYRCCAVDFISHAPFLFSFSYFQFGPGFFNMKIEILKSSKPTKYMIILRKLTRTRTSRTRSDVERIESTGQEGVTTAAKSKRRKIKVAPYYSADYPKIEADIKYYLEAVFEEPMELIHALSVVARARGVMKLSKDTGITRAGLYKALSPDGNPSFRDRDEDCRRIWYAPQLTQSIN